MPTVLLMNYFLSSELKEKDKKAEISHLTFKALKHYCFILGLSDTTLKILNRSRLFKWAWTGTIPLQLSLSKVWEISFNQLEWTAMSEHRLHSYNFSKSFIKQGIHHIEKFLSSLEMHQLFCLNASHIYKTTLCVWFCQCVQRSYKTKYEKWQNFPGKIHQLYFFCISVTLEMVKGIQNWYERIKLSQSYHHSSLKDEKSSMFKFVKQTVRHWSLHWLKINHASHKERKEGKKKKVKKRKNHEKPMGVRKRGLVTNGQPYYDKFHCACVYHYNSRCHNQRSFHAHKFFSPLLHPRPTNIQPKSLSTSSVCKPTVNQNHLAPALYVNLQTVNIT